MSYLQAVILAVIQGFTEFLPISSSAHLIIPAQITDWPDQGLDFDVAAHFGSLLAVLIYFRQTICSMMSSVLNWAFRKSPLNENGKMFFYVLLGTIPVGIFGYLCKDMIEHYLRSTFVIALTTIIFGILLLFAEIYNKKFFARALKNPHTQLSSSNITIKKAFLIGCAQILALVPGTSRSGITMTAGYFLKLTPEKAASFSFLLSIPVILLSTLLLGKEIIESNNMTADLSILGIGVVCSFITAFTVIHLFLKYLTRTGMLPYVVYRIILGAFLLYINF